MSHKDVHQNYNVINRKKKNPIRAQRKIIPSVNVGNTSERVKSPTPTPPPPIPPPHPSTQVFRGKLTGWMEKVKGRLPGRTKMSQEKQGKGLKQPLVLGTESFAGVCGVWGGFFDGSVVKNVPPTQETQEMWVQSLGGEDPLEKEMSTHSSILAWEIPRREEPGGPQSMGLQRIRQDWAREHALTWSGKGLGRVIQEWSWVRRLPRPQGRLKFSQKTSGSQYRPVNETATEADRRWGDLAKINSSCFDNKCRQQRVLQTKAYISQVSCSRLFTDSELFSQKTGRRSTFPFKYSYKLLLWFLLCSGHNIVCF